MVIPIYTQVIGHKLNINSLKKKNIKTFKKNKIIKEVEINLYT